MSYLLKTTSSALAFACLLALSACGTTPPSDELVAARSAMTNAQGGEAARLEPEELRQAELALQEAERAHEDEPGSQLERDLAYVAERKILTVQARARQTASRNELEAEREAYTEDLEQANLSRQQRLDAIDEQLAEVRGQLDERGDVIDEQTEALRARESELVAQQQELNETRQERDAAQQRLAEAMAALEEFATLRREQEDLVITLNGSVLFESDESELMGTAERRLQAVAQALQGRDQSTFVVEGHTDSRASDSYNQRLSQARAESVRNFLVSQGVAESDIRAVGRGEAEPVASNDTAEGRANNRRVEIHVTKTDQRQSSR
ncbi:MAG: OmpA family protein [Deltaproteobacteria bacterium]|nr:OmpA family protein [Deltaproteobacteria bacterium]